MTGKGQCRFIPDAKRRNEAFWYCTVHHTRVTDPLVPCFFSRCDGTPLEPCQKWSSEGCPRYVHCHATFAPRKGHGPESLKGRR